MTEEFRNDIKATLKQANGLMNAKLEQKLPQWQAEGYRRKGPGRIECSLCGWVGSINPFVRAQHTRECPNRLATASIDGDTHA